MKKITTNDIVRMTFDILEKRIDLKERSVTSYISKSTLDRGGDIVRPEGLDEKNYRKNPIVLFNHNPDKPVGTNLWLKKEDEGVLAKTQFGTTPFADDIFQLTKEKILNAFSIGFIPKVWERDEKEDIVTFTDWELLEYSVVSVPMNPDAVLEGLKMVKSEMAKSIFEAKKESFDIEKLEERVNKLYELYEILQDSQIPIEDLEELERKVLQLTKNSVETLDNRQVLKEIKDKVIGDVS